MKPMTKADAGLLERPGYYMVNEIFESPQGEGAMAGTPMLFVRFSKCNLRCSRTNSAGFDCDTDFGGGRWYTQAELLERIDQSELPWVIFTGGEPLLQLDAELTEAIHARGKEIALETNGTIRTKLPLDHITVSPKTAEHTIRQRVCHELRVVRANEQELSAFDSVQADFRFISPAFEPNGELHPSTLAWCKKLVLENPAWTLSVQSHKAEGIR